MSRRTSVRSARKHYCNAFVLSFICQRYMPMIVIPFWHYGVWTEPSAYRRFLSITAVLILSRTKMDSPMKTRSFVNCLGTLNTVARTFEISM